MRYRFAVPASAWLFLACSGCCFSPVVDTVPWWKGLPSMIIEPTSLEAMVWRDHLRAKHGQASDFHYSGLLVYDWPAQIDSVEELPVPPIRSEQTLPAPREPTGGSHRLGPVHYEDEFR
jgi:hypothetical protein